MGTYTYDYWTLMLLLMAVYFLGLLTLPLAKIIKKYLGLKDKSKR